jgi:thymidylate synthase (FAD)
MQDKWRHLREKLWANAELSVELIAMTIPGSFDNEDSSHYFNASGVRFYAEHVEPIVAQAASVSTGVTTKNHASLTRKLIELKHYTPLEAIQFNFRITGISKACGAQMSRHRIGQGHVSSSRRYQEQSVEFVYPLLDNINSEVTARAVYATTSDSYKAAYDKYLSLRHLGVKKGDARYLIPTASAQSRIWWINARALRDFLTLRLDQAAEPEIRRLALTVLTIVTKLTPNLFYDINSAYED